MPKHDHDDSVDVAAKEIDDVIRESLEDDGLEWEAFEHRRLRDEFAKAALPALIGLMAVATAPPPDPHERADYVARRAYEYADAMLEARKVKP